MPATLADVTVKNLCSCEGPRNQGQIKVQLSVTNTSQVPINAAIGNIRMLVAGDMPGPWTPNQPAAQPSTVTVEGRTYTAIPANGNGAWESEYNTFASHWYAGTVNPGETYTGDGPNNADLVFYVPAAPNGDVALNGLALVTNDGNTVLGWSAAHAWPAPSDPHTF